jgi:GT2 family glycosyltransferase
VVILTVMPRVLLVVPTLGSRVIFLRETLASIQQQSVAASVILVAPKSATHVQDLAAEFGASFLEDPGSLPGAINLGVQTAESEHEYVNWLGDDDLLEPDSLKVAMAALDERPDAVGAFGACRYVNEAGELLWVSKAGRWGPRILSWGPDLVPQPGMLIRTDAWRAVNGLDESFRFAFDLDLLLKLRQLGPLLDTKATLASFRWHGDSLTVGDRTTNLAESERAKRRYLTPTQQRLKWIWERPVRMATRLAASEVHRRARRASQ